jgi:hypothetical protein
MGLERWRFDEALDGLVVEPFLATFRRLDALDRRWCRLVAGVAPRSSSGGAPGLHAGE